MMSGKQDEQIETVLHALQHVEPSEAMQGRILLALEVAETARSIPAGRHRWPPLAASFSGAVPWLAAAALLLAAGSTLLLHRHGSRGIHSDQVTQSVSDPSGDITSHPNIDSSLALEEGEKSAAPSNSSTLARVLHVSQRHGIRLQSAEIHVSEARRGTSAVVADDRSFPAPPLPLTEQERLLLRLARREPPQQLAQLTSAALNTGFQYEKDAVTEFFAPAPPLRGQQEPPSYVPQAGQE